MTEKLQGYLKSWLLGKESCEGDSANKAEITQVNKHLGIRNNSRCSKSGISWKKKSFVYLGEGLGEEKTVKRSRNKRRGK